MRERDFVVRFKRHGAEKPELRWLSPEPAEQVVVTAENIPMAVRQFYREYAQETTRLTLLEVFEKRDENQTDCLLPPDLFHRD